MYTKRSDYIVSEADRIEYLLLSLGFELLYQIHRKCQSGLVISQKERHETMRPHEEPW